MTRSLRFGFLAYALALTSMHLPEARAEPAIRTCTEQITFESDRDDAYKYLEAQQREIYTQNPGLSDPYARAEVESPQSVSKFAELKARAMRACPASAKQSECALDPAMVDKLMSALPCLVLPTRFESPLFSSLIGIYQKEINILLPSQANYPQIRFGSLPTGTIDAQALLPPGSNVPLVILNRDLFFFTGAISKSVSDAIPITEGSAVSIEYSEDRIRSRLQSHPYIVTNFADAMVRLVQNGTSHGAVEITLDETHNHLHGRLVTAMDRFLISHEASHVLLGHVSDQSVELHLSGSHLGKAAASTALQPGTISIGPADNVDSQPSTVLRAEVRTREQEFQADALGFKLLISEEQVGNDPIAIMIAGGAPDVVFRVLDAADAYGSEVGGWRYADGNHPSAAERVAALGPVYGEIAKKEDLLNQIDFRVVFDTAFKVLLEQADPLIRSQLGLATKKQ